MPPSRLFFLVVVCLLTPHAVPAQVAIFGPAFNLMVKGGSGVVASNCSDNHIGAVGLQIARPLTGRLTLQAAGRGFWLAVPSACVAIMPPPPPPDGTYDVEMRDPLLGRSFVTTDVRL